jgi:cytochrome c oxidase cbb3-type subunit 3
MFKRVVNVVEALALVAAALFVLFLFTGWPGTDDGGGGGGGESAPGAAAFASNCARCHGADGSGGIGPQLSDGAVVDRFPDPADEIELVTRGQDGMPAFGGTLSAKEIEQVVEYTRTL